MKKCTVEDCDRSPKARGWCDRHYRIWRRHGDPRAALRFDFRETPRDRFWTKVDRSGGPDACWPWTAAIGSNGYGEFGMGGKKHWAHRLAYAFGVGPIPPGLEVDHECHNLDRSCSGGSSCRHRRCCNPAHLKPRTHQENVSRGFYGRKTHCPRGHEYTAENTYRAPSTPNKRRCRACAVIVGANRVRRE